MNLYLYHDLIINCLLYFPKQLAVGVLAEKNKISMNICRRSPLNFCCYLQHFVRVALVSSRQNRGSRANLLKNTMVLGTFSSKTPLGLLWSPWPPRAPPRCLPEAPQMLPRGLPDAPAPDAFQMLPSSPLTRDVSQMPSACGVPRDRQLVFLESRKLLSKKLARGAQMGSKNDTKIDKSRGCRNCFEEINKA